MSFTLKEFAEFCGADSTPTIRLNHNKDIVITPPGFFYANHCVFLSYKDLIGISDDDFKILYDLILKSSLNGGPIGRHICNNLPIGYCLEIVKFLSIRWNYDAQYMSHFIESLDDENKINYLKCLL